MAVRTVKRIELTSKTITGGKIYIIFKYDDATKTVTGTVDNLVVYRNGVYLIDSISTAQTRLLSSDLLSTKAEKDALHKTIKDEIRTSIRSPLPGFVSQDSAAQEQGLTTHGQVRDTSTILSNTLGNAFINPLSIGESIARDTLASILSPNVKLDEYGTSLERMKKLFPTPLKYPVDILDNQQDRLVITQYTYVPPYGNVILGEQTRNRTTESQISNPIGGVISLLTDTIQNSGKTIFSVGAQRQSEIKDPIQKVILPIPNNVSDSNSANWGGDTMNTLSMAAAGNIPTLVGSQVASTGLGFLNQIAQQIGGPAVQAITDAINSGKEPGLKAVELFLIGQTDAINNPLFKTALQSALLKARQFDVSPETILARGYGVVPNSNLELLFNGPTLRAFSFGYMMTPRSDDEALMIRKILRFFKQGMAPKKKNNTGGYGGSSLLLATPNVFKLEYKTGPNVNDVGGDIEGLNKFKICALTNVQTSYAEGTWLAYEKGQPVRIQINLTFKELEPVYESDYSDKKATLYSGSNPPVKDNEIGY